MIDAFTFTASTGRAVAETMLPSKQALRKMEVLLQIVGMMVQAEVVERGVYRQILNQFSRSPFNNIHILRFYVVFIF